MASSHIPLFFGDNRNGELPPRQWLQIFEGEALQARLSETEKITLFGMKMAAGDDAGEWWDSVDGVIDKTKWENIKTTFIARWPKSTKGARWTPNKDLESLEQDRALNFRNAKVNVNPSMASNEQTRHAISRSFISDTVTVPSKEMFDYSVRASLGDDVFGAEPSTNLLEQHVAKLLGKEAALFVPSGTMSNQVALRTHLTQPPHSVLCDVRSHINAYEAGGAGYHSQAAVTAVLPSNGHHLTLSDMKKYVITVNDVHYAPTRVIALENTLTGCIFPQEEVLEISRFAKSIGIRMHLDGARIWHVAAETGLPLSELCAPFDSVSCCFSKGLGAPVGSCLVGSTEFINKARWIRKLFGGGMRQSGLLAGAAAYALSHNFELLPSVHALARKLEKGLRELGVEITSPAETCMVCYDPSPLGLDYANIADRAAQLSDPITLLGSRLVVHIQTTPEAINDFLALIEEMANEKNRECFIPPEPSKAQAERVPRDAYVGSK